MESVKPILHIPLTIAAYAMEIVAELASVAEQNWNQRLKVKDVRVHSDPEPELELEWSVGQKRMVVSIPYDDGPDYYVQAFGPESRDLEMRLGRRLSTGATLNDVELTEIVGWLIN